MTIDPSLTAATSARARFRADMRGLGRGAWLSNRTVYAIGWFRVGEAIDGMAAGAMRTLLGRIHGVVQMFVCAFTGIEVCRGARIGPGLRFFHGQGTVINAHAVIGRDAVILQGVTLGQRKSTGDAPTIGDRVEIGAHAQLLGAIRVGSDVRIGAAAVVLTDVPDGATVVGNPGRILPAPSRSED